MRRTLNRYEFSGGLGELFEHVAKLRTPPSLQILKSAYDKINTFRQQLEEKHGDTGGRIRQALEQQRVKHEQERLAAIEKFEAFRKYAFVWMDPLFCFCLCQRECQCH